jgi:hypothetical protein
VGTSVVRVLYIGYKCLLIEARAPDRWSIALNLPMSIWLPLSLFQHSILTSVVPFSFTMRALLSSGQAHPTEGMATINVNLYTGDHLLCGFIRCHV